MKKEKLGILTCSNMTQVLDCPVGACLHDMHNRKGAFKSYGDNGLELVGVISCNGCPTRPGADMILPRIEGLLHYGMTHLHLSYCMLTLCPYVKKYVRAIRATYPDLNVILGTHESHRSDDEFREKVRGLLTERHRAIIP